MEDEDQSSKTEEPSERKLRKAREQGNVPKSKEVNNLFMLLGMLLAVGFSIPIALGQIFEIYMGIFTEISAWRANTGDAVGTVSEFILRQSLMTLAPTFGIFVVIALFGGFIQTGPMFSTKPIEPKLSKISLIKGIGRMFSLRTLAEFLKTIFKMVVIGAALYLVFHLHRNEFLLLNDKSLVDSSIVTQIILMRMLMAAIAIMIVLAVIDFLFQQSQFIKDQRMSLREIKDEYKETEGDPHVKARQRQIRMERARARMMQSVPDADVVITNPTHYSVALSYKPERGQAAPMCVAKGTDHIAMKIREIANENNVPLYEDPPLARRLYADVDLEEEVPVSLYEATAKVIAFIMNLKKRRTR